MTNKIKVENMTIERNMLTGMFRDRESTENAYNTLHDKGYTKDDINLVMSDETRKKHFSGDMYETKIGAKAAEGARKVSTIGSSADVLVGSGIPEDRFNLYELGIENGNIVMGVHPRNDEDALYFKNNWQYNKGKEIQF